jgi:hypothetical protein
MWEEMVVAKCRDISHHFLQCQRETTINLSKDYRYSDRGSKLSPLEYDA